MVAPPTPMPFVQFITDLSTVSETAVFERLRRAADLPAPARAHLEIQLREKQLPARDLLRLAEQLRAATADLGARLIVNDRVDIAVLVGADGVHLGRASMSIAQARSLLGRDTWVSRSAHSVGDVVAAAADGANATLLSPIFASPGKGTPLGPGALSEARAALQAAGLSLTLYALGGVTAENAPACLGAGAEGVAAIRADLLPLLSAPA
jgi:thiamine-phosphate pyrophosphorylase